MLLPPTLYAVATFGLPSSSTFFSGRGRSLRSLRRVVLSMALLASAWLIALAIITIPALEHNILQTAPDDLLRLVLVAIPFQFSLSLIGSILFGRQIVRNYNLIVVGQSFGLFLGIIVFVGVLGLGVRGAVLSFVLVTALTSIAALLELRRATSLDRLDRQPVSYRELLTYGVKLYPSVVTGFFNSRADIFLLSWLLGSDTQVGLYAVAVGLAELTYYVPDAVSSVYFPRVASETREQANATVAAVSRATAVASAAVAIGIVPASLFIFEVLLPHYRDALGALVILLPAVVALSISKVLTGYLTGLGRGAPVSIAATAAVVLNIGCNLVLIPALGIVGAALSSLVSYGAHLAIMVVLSSRVSGIAAPELLLPRLSDVRRLAASGIAVVWDTVGRSRTGA
jgi:O-antigen/teichoic acid export membrane protein